jgi:hypothetical protein
MAYKRKPWRAGFLASLAVVESIEVWQYAAFDAGGGACVQSAASMWAMVVLFALQPMLFLGIAEEERAGSWWFRQTRLRIGAWLLYAAFAALLLPVLAVGPGRCSWWFCDSYTGTSIGPFGHIAWHLSASSLTHAGMLVYASSIVAMAMTGAWVTALLFASTCAANHYFFGAHAGPATWCSLSGAVGAWDLAKWAFERRRAR